MNKVLQPTLIDRLIGYFNPRALLNRHLAVLSVMQLRQYDSASLLGPSGTYLSSASANRENRQAIQPIRESARDLVRNAPFAAKGVQVIVNGVVGWGIELQLRGGNEARLNAAKKLWAEWSGGLCSVDNADFATLQHRAMTAIVVDGESLFREVVVDRSIRLHQLEADHIATQVSFSSTGVESGIQIDGYGRPVNYALYTNHPGDGIRTTASVPATQLIHTLRRDRPGQLRGISWLSPVATALRQLSELQYTQLLRMKMAASISGVVTTNSTPLAPEQAKIQREAEWTLEPNTIKFLANGEKIEFPAIPNPEGLDGAARLALREVAAGFGITYESLSNDNSQTSFSSSRIGDLQFRSNVESWRWTMFVPGFLEPAFAVFKRFAAIRGVSLDGIEHQWIMPARQMISPTEEVAATVKAIRAGLQSLPSALQELGLDPEAHLKQISDSNAVLDKYGLVLDSDPRRTANEQLQSADNLQAIQGGTATPGHM